MAPKSGSVATTFNLACKVTVAAKTEAESKRSFDFIEFKDFMFKGEWA